ncbi:DUF3388 domain-containing protein [Abyssicoccus albus]|jgi:hypothetical protein|uniref:ACT domain protein n=1 Tax=Abyssicoccus albus TaxID=1817405 RepID=A0A1Q1G1R8_9BACL|nr:DUF3388 domain-containing protein [Abyssicoccus albus]AQL56287.1 hypothetical protein BVH56_04835 [Abyssicoccus albus]RPF57886.1 ACT domain protein [Abyssicoccus albus]
MINIYSERNDEWYLEYELIINRVGLLGDISSLLGTLGITINTINGIDDSNRGLLIRTDSINKIKRFERIAKHIDDIEITKMRRPELRDRLAVRHGKYIHRDFGKHNLFKFERTELGILVDFFAELFKEPGHKLIGVRGMPRVGKTESIVAGSVCANKKWLFLSSTLIKQTVRNSLLKAEYNDENIYIIDGAVTAKTKDQKHIDLVHQVMERNAVKVIEHPDLFVQKTQYKMEDFDYIVEIRAHKDDQITYEKLNIEQHHWLSNDDDMFGFNF